MVVDLCVGNEVVVVGFVVDVVGFVVDVISSEFSKHSLPVRCQNLKQKLVSLCQY